ncbi:MAG TPA: CDP-alcohol phosphatidyltransferase family protein [Bacillota bacterium]|nr:CDP-alcohol phosphatidyltransferase family protein [Bacillota bacterium]
MTLSKGEFKRTQEKVMSLPGESLYARLFFRKISFIITPLMAKLPFTPNMLTVGSIIAGTAGAVLLMLPGPFNYLLGGLLVIAWFLLDVLDGDLARYKGQQSLKGVYLDSLGHYIVNPLIFTSFSVYLAILFANWLYLLIGFVTFVVHQYSRLAKDLAHSARYVQRDPTANPRQIVNRTATNQESAGVFGKILVTLSARCLTIFDALSITIITGFLRLLLFLGLPSLGIGIYCTLCLGVLAGTSLIVLAQAEKIGNQR